MKPKRTVWGWLKLSTVPLDSIGEGPSSTTKSACFVGVDVVFPGDADAITGVLTDDDACVLADADADAVADIAMDAAAAPDVDADGRAATIRLAISFKIILQ
jgi:hypothetical protein